MKYLALFSLKDVAKIVVCCSCDLCLNCSRLITSLVIFFLSCKIMLDISCEWSTGRLFTCNIKPYLFLKTGSKFENHVACCKLLMVH